MPRTKTFLTPAEYAVLGLVRQRPTYGYELQRQLSGSHGLARVCPVEPAMVYAVLKSLSGLELIDGEWDTREYPPKAIYAATADGDAEFLRWLRRPVGRIREMRRDFLVKLYFALDEDRQIALDLVEAQVEVCEAYADGAARALSDAEPGSFDGIVLASRETAARLTKEWLEGCRDSLASKRKA